MAEPPPPRPPRVGPAIRRVLVVRDGRMADAIADACNESCVVERVPGFLAGLAELVSGAADRLIGPSDRLAGMREAMAATLMEAGVADRVVLTDPDPAARRDHLTLGFHRVVDPGLPGPELAAALGLPLPGWQDTHDGSATAEVGRRAETEAAGPAVPGEWEGSPADADPAGAIGDSDLVEAIHDAGTGAPGRLPGLVARLLAAESRIEGIRLDLDPEDAPAGAAGDDAAVAGIPAGHASVRVCFRGDCFGCVHAPPPAGTQSLAPWAAWAARWLALDRQTRQLRELAMKDELTGVWNRRYFNRFLSRILERAATDRQQVTLLVFDIDDFKRYNDLHGHAAGDAILAGAAQLMQSTVRAHDVVARIGGDEFAVIFWDPRGRREEGSSHPDDVLAIAHRFQRAITDLEFPQLSAEAPGTLTISGGIAGFPWDGRTPEELVQKADLMAMESKAQGKNAITLGETLPPPVG